MRRLGQHFLRNSAVATKIIRALELRGDETVVEIGAGHGELTVPLAVARACTVVTIEKDAAAAEGLRARLRAEKIKNVDVRTGDALRTLTPSSAKTAPVFSEQYKITGNIPYYLTGRLLRIIGELAASSQTPERAVLMLQREVAERICATTPRMNRLAASVQFWADPKIICTVPKRDFSPPPQVDSAVVLLRTKNLAATAAAAPAVSSVAPDKYYAAVRALFAQPRKTILNNLRAGRGRETREGVAIILQKIGIPPTDRPQDLTIAAIAAIARAYWG